MDKYKVGDLVSGVVLKANPFGLFVELDPDIHGLAHISELSDKPITDLNEIAKSGDTKKFRIISIEPKDHRLGLSLKAPKEGKKILAEKDETETKAPKTKEKEAKAEKKEVKPETKEKKVKPAKEKKVKTKK